MNSTTTNIIFTTTKILALVVGVNLFFKTRLGDKIGDYFPTPFWIYFLSIVFSLAGILPKSSPVYGWIGLYALAAAVFLMLVGAPVPELVKMGRKAAIAMLIASGTIFGASILTYALFLKALPPDSWKAVGALLGTWIGGSANMIAVKEILAMPDATLAPLIIVDTILSYSWLALLFLGVAWQSRFDQEENDSPTQAFESEMKGGGEAKANHLTRMAMMLGVLVIGFVMGEILVKIGGGIATAFPFLSVSGWVLLLASTTAVLCALTPLRKLERGGASKVGTFLLYIVLITIGAKTDARAITTAPIFLAYGIVLLIIHGAISLFLGRVLKIPLFLLSTASQANIGGAVSAPIVATAYKPGTAHIGVLMAIAGAVGGTYLGLLGAWICRWIEVSFR